MRIRIGRIVEGHAEVESVPELIRGIAQEQDPAAWVDIPRPVRLTKSKLLKPGELERAVELAAANAGKRGGVLVVLDSDEDCPAELSKLLRRVREERPDLRSGVVLAKREFESWFLASAESLRGHRGLPPDIEPPSRPEEIHGAKEWLSKRLVSRDIRANAPSSVVHVPPESHPRAPRRLIRQVLPRYRRPCANAKYVRS